MKKKIMYLVFALVATMATSPCYGQAEHKRWTFGPKVAGMVYLYDEPRVKTAGGISVGGFAQLKKKWFAFRPELMYSFQRDLYSFKKGDKGTTKDSHYAVIGILCGFYVYRGLNLETGPSFDIPLYQKQTYGSINKYGAPEFKVNWSAGIGYDFPCGLILSGRYALGTPLFYPKSDGGPRPKRTYSMTSLSVGWAF